MRRNWYIGIFCCWLTLPLFSYGQNENDNADVTTETVEDEFQNHFFEALRERAIENYGKAIGHLLECKKLDPENAAVDYELGINYTSAENFEEAETHLLAAIAKDPENRWYSEALFDVYQTQHKTGEAITLAEKLSATNDAYKTSLVYLYANVDAYDKAVAQLDKLDAMYGASEERERLRKRYLSLERNKSAPENVEILEMEEIPPVAKEEIKEGNPFEDMQKDMTRLMNNKEYQLLLQKSDEALESYPAQPFFYYMNGAALQGMRNFKRAVLSYEMALDYLIDDVILEKKIYAGLAECHKQLGNIQKEQEYLEKAKNI